MKNNKTWLIYERKEEAIFWSSHRSNQCPRQAIWPHSNQSGTERIDSFILSRTIFSSPFWKSSVSESTRPAAKKDLSLVISYGHWSVEDLHWRHTITFYQLHKRASHATCHTSYLLHWTPSTNSRTNILSGDTKNNLFSLWLKFTSAIRKNLSLLCFKEVSLFILYYNLTYSDVETNHKH